MPQGKGLDQWQSGPIEGFDTRMVGSGSYDEAAGAEVFVVTAGIARKPGMSRDDLVKTNAGIVRSVTEQIARVAPKSIIVVVSNPLDVMCYVAMKASRFPRERVIGMAGVLDTARYRAFLAEALDVSVEDIQAMVLGGHGDTMVPLVSYTTVSGIPVTQLIDQAKLDADRRPAPATAAPRSSPSSRPARPTTRPARPRCRWSRPLRWTRSGSCRAPPGSRENTASRTSSAGCPARSGGRGWSASSRYSDRTRAGGAAQVGGGGPRHPGRRGRVSAAGSMSRLRLLWDSSVGKKVVMAVTGLIWVAYLITHVLANLLVFQGPAKINAYSAFLHGTGGALWAARLVLIVAVVLHVVAAVQLAGARQEARPVGYAAGREPQVSTLASRTMRWGGALILVFLVYHILHFTVGTAHPDFIEGDPYHNVATGFRNPLVVAFYLIAMAAVGLHLYHGVWSSGRSLGVSPPSPHPLRRTHRAGARRSSSGSALP